MVTNERRTYDELDLTEQQANKIEIASPVLSFEELVAIETALADMAVPTLTDSG